MVVRCSSFCSHVEHESWELLVSRYVIALLVLLAFLFPLSSLAAIEVDVVIVVFEYIVDSMA